MNNCPDCGGVGYFRADVLPGHPQFGKLIPCDNPIHHPDRLARLAKVSGLGSADLERRLSDIKRIKGNESMLDSTAALLAEPYGWLWIHGGPGNAKSEVLIALVNEFNLSGRGPAVYTKFTAIVDYMRDAFSERKERDKHGAIDLGYVARFEQLKAIKVLAIDEMDKARDTEFMFEFRFNFLDERYRQAINGETITLFASNGAPSALSDVLWDRVRDGRFKVIHNTAGSARPNMKRK